MSGFERRKKHAPYSRQLNDARGSIAILTGREAWRRAASRSWFVGRKLVLPFGEDPEAFVWPVADTNCIVFGFGDPEPWETLDRLSVELIQSGALFVIWNLAEDDGPATLYRPASGEGTS
ncbi:hypothetical protein [Methylococcus sp. EFPC2]|uniref:hypothetical protein n=1 Tax=Methylococcus sp. EFPC2 TaxID=2812648 RepID=UPI001966FB1C|nr:hypothetical protein [Methylococcus sp. EFPC2]QSA97505.1 hypothetical protein JWZ97_01255 [Methylococcus sp. EFPC2]